MEHYLAKDLGLLMEVGIGRAAELVSYEAVEGGWSEIGWKSSNTRYGWLVLITHSLVS